jgi:hypothetical protein
VPRTEVVEVWQKLKVVMAANRKTNRPLKPRMTNSTLAVSPQQRGGAGFSGRRNSIWKWLAMGRANAIACPKEAAEQLERLSPNVIHQILIFEK